MSNSSLKRGFSAETLGAELESLRQIRRSGRTNSGAASSLRSTWSARTRASRATSAALAMLWPSFELRELVLLTGTHTEISSASTCVRPNGCPASRSPKFAISKRSGRQNLGCLSTVSFGNATERDATGHDEILHLTRARLRTPRASSESDTTRLSSSCAASLAGVLPVGSSCSSGR
eukprot:16440890-Heterocapsa_arctica.AAC.2